VQDLALLQEFASQIAKKHFIGLFYNSQFKFKAWILNKAIQYPMKEKYA